MNEKDFLETAVKHLPGGLILTDLQGRIRAVNKTAETLLGLSGPVPSGMEHDVLLSNHPKIVQVIKNACRKPEEANRQELTTTDTEGEKMVLGYGILVLRNSHEDPIGVGMTFQDITRMIPLMDSHRFLDIALKNLPGGLIFVDLQGNIRGVNQNALKLLEYTEDIEPGTPCHKAFADHPQVYKTLLSTCESLNAANRKEITTRRKNHEKMTLGYGTLILRNPKGEPIGIGMTFQDITRFIPLPLKAEFIQVVDRYFTPFALILVASALWLGFAEGLTKQIALGIVMFSALFNQASAYLAKRRTEWAVGIGNTRLFVNFALNIGLVYLLGTFWGPMWLLFALTPIATALHASFGQTLLTAGISAGTLLGIYAARGLTGEVGWGMASVHAIFIVFVSLFSNAIAKLVMQMKSAAPAIKPAATNVVAADKSTSPIKTHKLAA